jgi:hypothetical protein
MSSSTHSRAFVSRRTKIIRYRRVVAKKPLTPRGVARMREREASVGLDAEDEAAKWLAEHDPPPAPKTPKAAKKSVALHRFKQRRPS